MTEHFNKLTPAEDERLTMLAEECAEVIQAVTKIQRHGYDSHHPDGGPDNRDNLQRELTDMSGVLCLMIEAKDILPGTYLGTHKAMRRKLRYAHHQGEIG
jgi:NTP pyrophosphatase (non-canonical NTP hydrolase)